MEGIIDLPVSQSTCLFCIIYTVPKTVVSAIAVEKDIPNLHARITARMCKRARLAL